MVRFVEKIKQRTRAYQRNARAPLRAADIGWIFLAGSVIGFVLEGIWSILLHGAWENHASTVWGPFCIIYGIGMVLMYVLSIYVEAKPLPVRFLSFAVTGSLLEYVASLFQELAFGSVSWNYEGQLLNVNGRISLRMTLIWGLLGVLFSSFVFPFFARILEKTHVHGWQIACACLCGFMLVNLFMSAAAVLRWRERGESQAPSNAFEEYLDGNYGDARMERTFSNLKFLE
ncbi:MAG: hypothetical protein E7643_07750 [Ruminococcaceae bacterium]|nr:hypothetical protein [Oscillospiraceae bacterium]